MTFVVWKVAERDWDLPGGYAFQEVFVVFNLAVVSRCEEREIVLLISD